MQMLCFIFSVIIMLAYTSLSANDVSRERDLAQGQSPVWLTEFEKQQKILEQYKPLIKPRTYEELIVYKDNTIAPLDLNRLPELEEVVVPNRAPNVLLIPYLLKSFAHPAYEAKFSHVNYFLAVSCEDPRGFDDCSTTPHNRFANKKVYVKFIQSNDPKFTLVKGMRVGQSYEQIQHLFAVDAEIHGDGECLKTSGEWLACFDAGNMAVNKKRLQMMPAKDAKLLRFIKIKGKGY